MGVICTNLANYGAPPCYVLIVCFGAYSAETIHTSEFSGRLALAASAMPEMIGMPQKEPLGHSLVEIDPCFKCIGSMWKMNFRPI